MQTLLLRLKNSQWILLVMLAFNVTVTAHQANAACSSTWPQWNAYSNHFIQTDGRVIEHSQKGRTTSEAQGYSLFHALVANDRQAFRNILAWTSNNLADGNLAGKLPAWVWGQQESGEWGVIDSNTASDADMWIAYSLLEAGRLWESPKYTRLGQSLLRNIEKEEILLLPNLGEMLLPGKTGFQLGEGRWRLNPSYLPIQLLRRFNQVSQTQVWSRVIDSTEELLLASGSNGVIPDWVIYDETHRFITSSEHAVGSYDAIRVYLWLGMLNNDDPLKLKLLNQLNFTSNTHGLPPEKVDTRTGIGAGKSPIGFKAALAPYFKSKNARKSLHRTIRMIDEQWRHGLLTNNPVYYDQNLAMFALAWLERRFEFDPEGRLKTHWEQSSCSDTAGKLSS